jgi:hypothetical protein
MMVGHHPARSSAHQAVDVQETPRPETPGTSGIRGSTPTSGCGGTAPAVGRHMRVTPPGTTLSRRIRMSAPSVEITTLRRINLLATPTTSRGGSRIPMQIRSLLTGSVLLTACAVVAIWATGASAHVSTTKSTKVTKLHAFTVRRHAVRVAALPPSVAEVEARLGADPATSQEPVVGTPSVFLAHRGPQGLCTIIAVTHANGSCDTVLRDAGGSLRANLSIVDRKLFVWGLAANNVSAVSVTVSKSKWSAGSTSTARLTDNVFLTSLSYDGGGLGAVTVTDTRSDGSTTSVRIPPVPPAPTG